MWIQNFVSLTHTLVLSIELLFTVNYFVSLWPPVQICVIKNKQICTFLSLFAYFQLPVRTGIGNLF